MNQNPGYKSGDWKAICDSCGFEFMASELKLRWDGFRVCPKDWETRNPQDFIRSVPEKITPPWTRSKDGSEWGGPNVTTGTLTVSNFATQYPDQIIYAEAASGFTTVDIGSSATLAGINGIAYNPFVQVCKVGTNNASYNITVSALGLEHPAVILIDEQAVIYKQKPNGLWSIFSLLGSKQS